MLYFFYFFIVFYRIKPENNGGHKGEIRVGGQERKRERVA
jgi:hypothetical protein